MDKRCCCMAPPWPIGGSRRPGHVRRASTCWRASARTPYALALVGYGQMPRLVPVLLNPSCVADRDTGEIEVVDEVTTHQRLCARTFAVCTLAP